MISARKVKHLDATTMFTYSHANTPLGHSERAYYLSYFINTYNLPPRWQNVSISYIIQSFSVIMYSRDVIMFSF